MHVLFLDDDEARHQVFKKAIDGLGMDVTYVYTAKDAIAELEAHHFDIFFSDHDLGGRIYVDPEDSNTGSQVARWLHINPDHLPTKIILHTFNKAGADYMLGYLLNAQWIPFGFVKTTDIINNIIKEMITENPEKWNPPGDDDLHDYLHETGIL